MFKVGERIPDDRQIIRLECLYNTYSKSNFERSIYRQLVGFGGQKFMEGKI